MEIKYRSEGLAYPRAIKQEKLEIIYAWLREFKFSSAEVLSEVLESRPESCARFFRELRSEGWLKSFRNEHTGAAPYLCLSSKALAWAETWGYPREGAMTKTDNLCRTSQVLHDLLVQRAVLREIATKRYTSVIYEPTLAESRPDAILTRAEGLLKIAIELERWQKNEAGMYTSFYAHAKAIVDRVYAGTIFYFRNQTDAEAYKRRFEQEEWPIFKRIKGRITKTDAKFRPSDIDGLQRCFAFSVLPTEAAKPPVKTKARRSPGL